MDEAESFQAAAAAYCAAVEQDPMDPVGVLRQLLRLVDAALGLPAVAPSSDDRVDDPVGLDADTEAVEANVARALGPPDWYWVVFDPLELSPDQPVVGSMSDDLAEVYADIRRGLHAGSLGATDEAIWEWRFGFDSHWGRHAVHAITALHHLLVSEDRRR